MIFTSFGRRNSDGSANSFQLLSMGLSFLLAGLTCFQCAPTLAYAASQRKIYFYHSDHLGSTSLVTDEQGQVVARAEYRPYGATTVAEQLRPEVPSAFKFTGQRLDDPTGLYFFHSRYYDPQLGRFIQPDSIVQAPTDPQTLNRYSYVRNNPLKYTDPSGHFFFLPFHAALLTKVVIGAAVGAALNSTVAAFTGGYLGKAASTGALGGAIVGAGAAVAGAWSGASAHGQAFVMAGAGGLAGTAGAAMNGQPLGQGAAMGAGFGFVRSYVPTLNVPWAGHGAAGGLINPVLNDAITGAAMGAGVATIQGEDAGQGALIGAVYGGAGTAFNMAVGHTVGFFGSGRDAPAYDEKNGVFTYGNNTHGAITFGNVIFRHNDINSTGSFGDIFLHELGHASPQSSILGPLYLPAHGVSLVIGGIAALAVSVAQLRSTQPGGFAEFRDLAHDLSPLENNLLGDHPTAWDLHREYK